MKRLKTNNVSKDNFIIFFSKIFFINLIVLIFIIFFFELFARFAWTIKSCIFQIECNYKELSINRYDLLFPWQVPNNIRIHTVTRLEYSNLEASHFDKTFKTMFNQIDKILTNGQQKAKKIAEPVLKDVKKLVGFCN